MLLKKDADDLVEKTFKQEYDENRFLRFIKELGANPEFAITGDLILEGKKENIGIYKEYISHCHYFGVHTDSKGRRIIFASANLTKPKSRDRARVMQRNFAAALLQGKISGKIRPSDAALIAFYDDSKEDWRLSLITIERTLDCKDGKICATENLSPAKRSSFLVGRHESCHTCQKRFEGLLIDESKPFSLESLTDIFKVEAVTDDFFKEYKECFFSLADSLQNVVDSDERVRDDLLHSDISVSDFSKRLLGQIVFLYFLQKKGWLGVDVDNEWGSGPKDFMNRLFNGEIIPYKNFFDEILEPLFYDSLAKKHDSDYSPLFKKRIPFLNGGLFEAHYAWEKTHITIDNSVFEKIFETFERYNFTIKEDEPLEREVAVDPEMLGKVFESLLDVQERKGKGAFYTPRYVVHYICQQSLIEYLSKHISIPREDIELFIQKGDELYASIVNKGDKDSGLPVSISDNAAELDKLLAYVKVADPAVGSGAFPVGMMNEIVKARNLLTATGAFGYGSKTEGRTIYDLKHHTMEHSIYGADLEPSAVDIAKLRFWLSLIVDEENPKEIRPLPNLDNKIMVGNSLLDSFAGVKLFDDELLSIDDSAVEEISELEERRKELMDERDAIPFGLEQEKSRKLSAEIESIDKRIERIKQGDPQKTIIQTFSSQKTAEFRKSQRGIKELRILQGKYFNEQDKEKKKKLRDEIDAKVWDIIEREVEKSNNPRAKKDLDNLKSKRGKPFFLWKLYFNEVFTRENPGFDCIIGNPPYIQLQVLDEEINNEYKKSDFSTFDGYGDIYCLFYEKGYELLRTGGTLGFITSNKWMRAGYGKKLRKFFAEKTNPLILIDFAGQKIFQEATVDVNILLYSKEMNENKTVSCTVTGDCSQNMSDYVMQNSISLSFNNSDNWTILSPIELSIKNKIQKYGTPLKDWDIKINFGIKTGCNEAFIISEDKKNELISLDPKSAEIIRPILRGRDIKRYGYLENDLYLITIPCGFTNKNCGVLNPESFIRKMYPSIYSHFVDVQMSYLSDPKKQKKSKGLFGRDDMGDYWWELRSCAYMEDFSKQKIVWARLSRISKTDFSDFPRFALVDGNYLALDSLCFFTGEHLNTLIDLLNSKYAAYYFFNSVAILDNGGMQMRQQYVENIPLPKEILNKQYDVKNIDELIFALFGLSDDEINYIISYLHKKEFEILNRE